MSHRRKYIVQLRSEDKSKDHNNNKKTMELELL